MKIAHVTPGLLPIPPKGWGAIEKMIWELHCNFLKEGHESKIVYLDELTGEEDIVHIHVGNLANMAHERGIPYYFTMSDHHTFLHGTESSVYKENYRGMQNSIRSFVGGKFLVNYFDGMPEYSPYGVNTEFFRPLTKKKNPSHRLLCVANNGYAGNPSEDRKGFGVAIAAAKKLGLPITIAGPKNNQNYFDKNPPDYDKLTILFDLSEEELLHTYQQHTIFLHPSQLEAGHPNLTLLEALACGLPIVGTFEQDNYLQGMEIVNATVDEVSSGIVKIINNYENYTTAALTQAERLSWRNRAKELLTLYESDRQSTLSGKLKYHYSRTDKVKIVNAPKININVIDGLFVEILGGPSTKYKVKLINRISNQVIYEDIIANNCWVKSAAKYFINWKVEISDMNSSFTYVNEIDLFQKKVYICLDSSSLGDTLAWIPYIEEFRKLHQCQMVCSTFWNDMFASEYPNITFVNPGDTVMDITAMYRVGLFYNENQEIDTNRHPYFPLNRPLQQYASDILGLPYKEIRPLIKQQKVLGIADVVRNNKQITIAIHSTSQAKYWNNPNGWQTVVDYLKSKKYNVKLLSQEPDGYMGNKNPTGVAIHPKSSIDGVISELKKSKLFIGLGSGLSWLSWAVGTPTMIISGFSDPVSEMKDCIRIKAPAGSCTGCFNRLKLDPGDWHWCPDHKNTPRQYECSRNITPEMVIRELEKVL